MFFERLKFRNINIFMKITTVTIVTVFILITGFFTYLLPVIEKKFHDEKVEGIRNVVNVGVSMVEKFYAYSELGFLDKRDAKNKALDFLRSIRYKGKEYFFVLNGKNAHMIMHADKPSLNGTDVSGTKDANGIYIFRDIVKSASKDKTGGFTEYVWIKPGAKVASPKITYSKHFKNWNWVIASGIYIDDIDKSLAMIKNTIIIFMIIIAVVSLIITFIIAQYITSPIKKSLVFAKDISEGDLTSQLDVARGDEIGKLSDSLNVMSENLRRMFTEIADGATTLSSSSTELAAISEQMNSSAVQTSSKVENVKKYSSEVNKRIGNITDSAELSLKGVTSVAHEAEEMAMSIGEISKNTEKANLIAQDAVKKAKEALKTIEGLGSSALDINNVTDAITDISEQTNLLALNATIEAARAGESGRGFAVVAGEIKVLAGQTSKATSEIGSRISAIQNSTKDAVDKIKMIASIIEGVEEAVTVIAGAVSEQNSITSGIAKHANSVSHGIVQINDNLIMTTQETSTIVDDINEVNLSTIETADSSKNVKFSAVNLSALSEQLTSILNQYKYN